MWFEPLGELLQPTGEETPITEITYTQIQIPKNAIETTARHNQQIYFTEYI